MPAIRRTRPPEGLVPITSPNWALLCQQLGQSRLKLELYDDGRLIAWRSNRMWYVDAAAFRDLLGRWPDGYLPEAVFPN